MDEFVMKTDNIFHEGRDLGCIMKQCAKNTDDISHGDRDLGKEELLGQMINAKGRKKKRK